MSFRNYQINPVIHARPSAQLVEAARQQLTRIWWDEHRLAYDLVCSQTVIMSVRGEIRQWLRGG